MQHPIRTLLSLPAALLAAAAAGLAAPPTAETGVDGAVFHECSGAGVAQVELDATESTDPEGAELDFTWTGPFGTATGPTPTVAAPLGVHTVLLTVRDPDAEFDTASFTLVVVDTRAPSVDVTLSPSTLTASGQLRTISAFVDVQDACGGGTGFVLDSVSTTEPLAGSVVNAALGSPDTSFEVLAELAAGGAPRTYAVVYEATDSAGNTAIGQAAVRIAPSPGQAVSFHPSRMLFQATIGDAPPARRAVTVASASVGTVGLSSTASWLRWAPAPGGDSREFEVWVDPAGLPTGLHTAALRATTGGGDTAALEVTLRLLGAPDLFTLPDTVSLSFDRALRAAEPGSAGPVTQQVFVGARRSAAALTLSADAPWLQAEASAGSTPAYLTIAADPSGLPLGLHEGVVTIASGNPESSPVELPVLLDVRSSAAFEAPALILNSATLQPRPVAPGSLVTAFYLNPDGVTASAEVLPLPTELGGLSARVDGKPVRFLYVSPTQFNAQLPAGIPTGVAKMELYFRGAWMGETAMQILPAAPGIFVDAGAAVALNQDGSRNSAANPAPRGSVVSLYLTGQGLTDPPVPTGEAAPGAPFAKPVMPVSVTVEGARVQHQFAGLAPYQAGLLQVNLPTDGLPPGAGRTTVTIGGAPSNTALIYIGQ